MESFEQSLRRVARIGKPHGTKGEVTVQLFTDSPEARFASGNTLIVKPPRGAIASYNELTVRRSRWNKKILLLEFEEFSDRSSAENLRNSELYVATDDASDEQDGWYANQLIGFAVHQDTADSSKIGRVTDLLTGGAQALLKVRLVNGREVLIPFVDEMVPEVNENLGVVVVTPPPGLLELNQD